MINWSKEQEDIFSATGDMCIQAVAGSGKTTVCGEIIRRNPDQRFLYLVFNASAKQDAIKKFSELPNVVIHTAHSLAYNLTNYKNIENLSLYPLKKVFNGMSFKDIYLLIKDFEDFCNSDTNYYDATPKVKELYNKMVDRVIKPCHSFYLKYFQLSNPILGYNAIIYDEFQDSNPAMIDIFLRQNCRKICVGDSHQQIYSWRGAVNAFSYVKFPVYPMTQSYRFNQEIADIASKFVSSMKQIDFKMKGIDQGSEVKTRCILGRTNIMVLDAAITLAESGKKIHLPGGLNGYIYQDGVSIWDIHFLINGRPDKIKNPFIKSLKTTNGLIDFIADTNDLKLAMLYRFASKYKNLYTVLKTLELALSDNPDVTVSTVHKAKGLEWDEVTLLSDIDCDLNKEDEDFIESVNVVYVAQTRARKILR